MAGETCDHIHSKVTDSRSSDLTHIRCRRRRECLDCGDRFSTVEVDALAMKQVRGYELHLWINNRIKEAKRYVRETDLGGTHQAG